MTSRSRAGLLALVAVASGTLASGIVGACAPIPASPAVTAAEASLDALKAKPLRMKGLDAAITDSSWIKEIGAEFAKPYFGGLEGFLGGEKSADRRFFPAEPLIFNAFNTTPFDKVGVVILGQDPYPTEGQAMGLSFSVPDGVDPPASLRNIYQELHDDVGMPVPATGNLTRWAKQGVLLLNATLTVPPHQPAAHAGKGWETFTDTVIKTISDRRAGVVFLLWGGFAQQKQALIDSGKHHVLKAAHPSPLSARSGFFGCKHFSKANELLEKGGKKPIDWSLD